MKVSEYVVKSCDDCPVRRVGTRIVMCGHPCFNDGGGLDVTAMVRSMKSPPPPDACPLRVCALLVRVADEAR
jgi:ribosomal protein L36